MEFKNYEEVVSRNVSNNLKRLMEERGMSQHELAKRLGVSQQSVSRWIMMTSVPRANILMDICKIFGCDSHDITGDIVDSEEKPEYYYNRKTEEMAQMLFENKDLRLLFDAAKDVPPERLAVVRELLMQLKDNKDVD